MAQEVRAVYEKGRLRVLDPITLTEGEQVRVRIFSAQERTHAALGDLLVELEPDAEDASDDDALLAVIDATLQSGVSASEAIIQERQDGP